MSDVLARASLNIAAHAATDANQAAQITFFPRGFSKTFHEHFHALWTSHEHAEKHDFWL